MRAVYFTKNIGALVINGLPESTLIVLHEMYDAPQIAGRIVPWQQFKANYSGYETDQYVIVGANRMIKPSTRCNMVNDFLQVMTKTVHKISIDTSPFIGEPWRLWYHYSLAFGEWLGADYSYPIEGGWQKWFYYDQNHCKLSADNLGLYVHDTISDIDAMKSSFELMPPSDDEVGFYEEAKRVVFAKYDTPKLLVNSLLKLCNQHCALDVTVESYLDNRAFRIPDFGIYRFLKEENERRMAIYNHFAGLRNG